MKESTLIRIGFWEDFPIFLMTRLPSSMYFRLRGPLKGAEAEQKGVAGIRSSNEGALI